MAGHESGSEALERSSIPLRRSTRSSIAARTRPLVSRRRGRRVILVESTCKRRRQTLLCKAEDLHDHVAPRSVGVHLVARAHEMARLRRDAVQLHVSPGACIARGRARFEQPGGGEPLIETNAVHGDLAENTATRAGADPGAGAGLRAIGTELLHLIFANAQSGEASFVRLTVFRTRAAVLGIRDEVVTSSVAQSEPQGTRLHTKPEDAG